MLILIREHLGKCAKIFAAIFCIVGEFLHTAGSYHTDQLRDTSSRSPWSVFRFPVPYSLSQPFRRHLAICDSERIRQHLFPDFLQLDYRPSWSVT